MQHCTDVCCSMYIMYFTALLPNQSILQSILCTPSSLRPNILTGFCLLCTHHNTSRILFLTQVGGLWLCNFYQIAKLPLFQEENQSTSIWISLSRSVCCAKGSVWYYKSNWPTKHYCQCLPWWVIVIVVVSWTQMGFQEAATSRKMMAERKCQKPAALDLNTAIRLFSMSCKHVYIQGQEKKKKKSFWAIAHFRSDD